MYTITAGTEVIGTKSNKAKAVELATAHRNEHKVEVAVLSKAGNPVFELAAPKTIKMSKPYTRVVALPEGVKAPEGARVCYVRKQAGLALLHRPSVAREDRPYTFLNLKTGKERKGGFETTRDAGKAFVAAREAVKAQAAQA